MQLVMIASDWKLVVKNTLRGFCTIETASGLRIHEIALHERDGKRWIGLPSKPWNRPDGTTGWVPILEFRDFEAKNAFQRQALEAIDTMLAEMVEVGK